MNTRLQQFLAAENIRQAEFADKINVARASVSHILAGRNKPGYDFMASMLKCYPNLNMDWLISGKGKMYKSSGAVAEEKNFGDSLFNFSSDPEPKEDIPLPVEPPRNEYPDREDETVPNIKFTEHQNRVQDSTQNTVRQRKAVKIMIFYDDNTFQEFAK